MALVFREKKGAPLTIAEIDGNFKHLQERLESLVEAPAYVESIKELKQEGDVIMVLGTLGTELGRIQLPKYTPRLRGNWEPQKKYVGGDWVRYKGRLYLCQKTHQSRSFDEGDGETWLCII